MGIYADYTDSHHLRLVVCISIIMTFSSGKCFSCDGCGGGGLGRRDGGGEEANVKL